MSRPAAPLLVLALIACHEFEGSAYTAECASMMPVIEWSSDDAGTSWVEYGLDEDYGNTTLETTEPTRDHQHFLIGMPPLSEVFFRTVTEVEGKERWTEGSLVTGGVPSDLPDFDVTVELPEDHDSDPYVLGTAFGGQPVVFVVDRRGNWLWYKRIEPDKNPIELAFEPGTGNVLFNSFLTDHGEDDSNVTRASFDCTVTEDIDTPQGHHAFTLVPDGGMAYVAIDVRDYDMDDGLGEMSVVGDAIWVIPPDGGEHELLWSTWDDWRPPEKTEGWDSSFYPQGADWTHANSLHYDEKRDTYLLSLRNST